MKKSFETIVFKNKPKIVSAYAIVGPKEGKSPFAPFFDYVMKHDDFGEKSYELAERKMIEHAVLGAIEKSKIDPSKIDVLVAGDLLNQIISSSYAARAFDFPYIGVYGACSTMAESMAVGACLVDGKFFKNVVCCTASHFSSAERQYRFPLELGNQRPPVSQWTVTGSGACVLSLSGKGPCITKATFGKVVDFGVTDANNMGAAMAPAACDTLFNHFQNTNTSPDDFDLIATGDLGKLGSEILVDLMEQKGIKLGLNYCDCGQMYFGREEGTMCGGSGCGCSATIFNSFIMKRLNEGKLKRVLFLPTGALLSTVATQQGESIPGVCHCIEVCAEENGKTQDVVSSTRTRHKI